MAQTIIKLKTLEGKNFVDIEESLKLIKTQLQANKSVLIVAKGIQISRIAVVVRRAEEQLNCTIARMQPVNKKQKNQQGKQTTQLQFHVKLVKTD